MELYAEMKLMGDGYAGGFTSGMSMNRSETIEDFSFLKLQEGKRSLQKFIKTIRVLF